ncbi:TonB-dependent receptor [Pseudomaricurvus alkylphenolicus]|uniref:TonB-dependent receptor n=1 Tax=Pseudomaricurvus alkylphenolicus TaxID=1306991 RepID=UPI0014216A7A|nr:TonB-dependent receptor [Pseudomaricurvus alkylphenolicus]NIB40541.1 TonB-dependent receptor [Pseudomaricurvus alkylphenolicus]
MKFGTRALAAAIAASVVAPISLADIMLEEIVVTAQKREQGINDVGITVNAFSADQLDNFGIDSADDLEQLVPGLTINATQPAGAPVYTIRGVGFNDFTASATSTVGIYNDGAAIPFPVMTTGLLFDVERVEVLKGPQGDLYGRNTTAGQINFISRKPTEETQAGITASYGRYETLDLEGYVSGSISDSVQGRLSFKTVNSGEGWQESVSRPGDTLGERDELAIRALINWDISEDASLLLSLRSFKDESETLAMSVTSGIFPIEKDPDGYDNEDADWSPDWRPRNNNTTEGVTATLNWDMGSLSLTSITSYDQFERDGALFDSSGVPFEDSDAINTTDIEVFSQEIRLESAGDADFYWVAGLYYSEDEVDESYLLEFRDSFGLTADSNYKQTSDSVAVFGHVEYNLSEKFRLTLGGRYTEEERSWRGCTFDTGDGLLAGFYNFFAYPVFFQPAFGGNEEVPLGGCTSYNDVEGTPGFTTYAIFDQTMDTEAAMGKISLDYKPTDDILIYGTVSTGFKSGGFNGALALTHTQLQPYGKEQLTSYELGIKSTLLEGAMQLNAAAFIYDYEDKQELTGFVSPVGGVFGFDNVPESEVQGFELEMAWAITEGLRWDLGIAFLDTEIEEWDIPCPAGLLGAPVALPVECPRESVFGDVIMYDASGVGLNNSPEWQVSSTLSYTWALTNTLNMMIGVDVSYRDDNIGSQAAPDSSDKDVAFSGYVPDYTIANARIGLSDSEGVWSATLWGRNITDEYYWNFTSSGNGVNTRGHGMPTTYGLTVSYNYF